MIMSKSNGLFLLVLVVFVVLFKLFSYYRNKRNESIQILTCQEEKKKTIRGVVRNSYYDENINVKAFRINFTNGQTYINPIFLKSLNGEIQDGDSISKEPNTFRFLIFRKDNKHPIVIEDTVDCSKL